MNARYGESPVSLASAISSSAASPQPCATLSYPRVSASSPPVKRGNRVAGCDERGGKYHLIDGGICVVRVPAEQIVKVGRAAAPVPQDEDRRWVDRGRGDAPVVAATLDRADSGRTDAKPGDPRNPVKITGAHPETRPGEHAVPLGDLDPENELIGAEVPLESLHPRSATKPLRSAGTSQRGRRMRGGLRETDALLDLGVGEIGHREKPTQRRVQRSQGIAVGLLPRLESRDPFVQRSCGEQLLRGV